MRRKTFQGYAAAIGVRPEWTVANLVFQAGLRRTPTQSLVGSGVVYGREYMGYAQLMQASPSQVAVSLTGGGQIIAAPASLTPLAGGRRGLGS